MEVSCLSCPLLASGTSDFPPTDLPLSISHAGCDEIVLRFIDRTDFTDDGSFSDILRRPPVLTDFFHFCFVFASGFAGVMRSSTGGGGSSSSLSSKCIHDGRAGSMSNSCNESSNGSCSSSLFRTQFCLSLTAFDSWNFSLFDWSKSENNNINFSRTQSTKTRRKINHSQRTVYATNITRQNDA